MDCGLKQKAGSGMGVVELKQTNKQTASAPNSCRTEDLTRKLSVMQQTKTAIAE